MKLSNAGQARIVEVFSSFQGEGLSLGERHVFVRFGGCNLHCDYCDEPDTIPIPSGEIWKSQRLQESILSFTKAKSHEAISWTGGEPLLHAEFLEHMMVWAHRAGLRNYLETNGTRVEAFADLAAHCDVVAMDVKLPSATGKQTWSEHLEFLRVAPEKTFVKVVLTSASTPAEWRQIIRLMQEVSPEIPLVLQPATVFAKTKPLAPELVLKYLRQARGLLKDVRLIPQWHPLWELP